MAKTKRYGSNTINKVANRDYKCFFETFEQTAKRWALEAAKQLQDSYKTQKIFNGKYDREHEVWRIQKTVRTRSKVNGHVVKAQKVVSWGWNDENKERKKAHGAKGWYSTGHSYEVAMHNPVTVENMQEHKEANLDFIIQGQVTFHTTMQMLYVEAGVGANGRKNGRVITRPRDIPVYRKDDWSTKHRYVRKWEPGKGHAVRPNTRQQVGLLYRRMKWLAMAKHNFELSKWLIANFEEAFVPELRMQAAGGQVVYRPSSRKQKRNLEFAAQTAGRKYKEAREIGHQLAAQYAQEDYMRKMKKKLLNSL